MPSEESADQEGKRRGRNKEKATRMRRGDEGTERKRSRSIGKVQEEQRGQDIKGKGGEEKGTGPARMRRRQTGQEKQCDEKKGRRAPGTAERWGEEGEKKSGKQTKEGGEEELREGGRKETEKSRRRRM